jgi:hypothetical protein
MNHTIKSDVGYSVHKDPDSIQIDTTIGSGLDDIHNQFTRRIVELEDAAIKEALKKLGWLSPEEHAELLEKHEEELGLAWSDGYVVGYGND